MKIIIDIKNKEGLTINEVDEVVDELQDVLPSDITTILDGGVISRKCRHNTIVMRRDYKWKKK